jgi:alkanesulfonate monooxygenase SsuD/methylene tetrahydromethanopterin reductase-like flavin-dependent oxidoreductase (luciferase family)
MSAAFSGSPLIGTGSTTYSKPWELARRFATLDHLSGGRAGWNIVTTVTPLAAAAFGEPAHPGHADRYARAHEFVDVVLRAWDNWEDDAVVGDRENGVGRTAGSCTTLGSTGSTTTQKASCRSPAPRKVTRCSFKPGSPGPAPGWPRGTPSWCSPGRRR